MRLFLGWMLALFALAAVPAHAAYPPAPSGPVLDQAGIIPDAQEAALDAKLRAYNQRTGRALVVATVSSLEGESVEMYAVNLFEEWGVGGAKTDQGLLFLIAPTERRMRFETGYGLHGVFPDVLAGRVIRDIVTPRFKANDYPGGIDAGIDAVIAQLDRDPADAKAVAEAAEAAARQRSSDGVSIGGVIFWIVLLLFLIFLFSRGARRRRYRRGGPGVVLWEVGEFAANVAANVAINAAFGGDGGGDSDFGGFGGFGGGGSGGGGASGSW